ncbi:MAG TPA: cobalamin B12-binding domain-containing protein, partial [Candidatus Methanoperedens sp.]|nr:cobalamin B12-binding domain-containing protein [Candidatus Methanoperedens sp.]
MKCALVIPAWSPEEIFPSRTAAAQINYWQPLGTLYVAASLQQAGHEVRFLNGAFRSHEEILAELASFAPRLVGLYATAFGWPKAIATATDVRRILPDACSVAGGPFPSWAGAQCLREAPALDAVAIGEAEETLVEFAARLDRGEDCAGVAGLAFRDGGQIVENPPR